MTSPADRTPNPKPDNAWDDEDEIPRHPPVVPPPSESPIESLGEAIADVVTGGEASQAEERASDASRRPGPPARPR